MPEYGPTCETETALINQMGIPPKTSEVRGTVSLRQLVLDGTTFQYCITLGK
jgi:hypothetical protein